MEKNTKEFIVEEVKDFYKVIRLHNFRTTPGVHFDIVPMELMPPISGIDRVIHQHNAISPGPVGDVERPWYMHPGQDDYLIVLHGIRHVDIYRPDYKNVESFTVGPNFVKKGDKIIFDGPCMLIWPRGVFHRIQSGEEGSASLNFAIRYDNFDIKTNFNIYDLNTETGEFRVLREGHLDQK